MTTAPPVAELPFLAMLGALLLLGGAVSALAARRRPFTMLGLMFLSDIGLMILGLGLGGGAGLVGGTTQLIYQLAARCLALFTLARLARTAGSPRLDDLRGIRAALPLTGLFFGFAMFAGMGLSVFLVPDGRAFILHAALAAGHWGYAVAVALAGMALAAATVLSVQAICLESGQWRESAHVLHAPSATFHVLAGLFAVFIAAFGLAGHTVTALVADALGVAHDALPAFGARWHPAALVPYAG
ncbi:oxidoreductase, partial [Desulfovibrio oxamicus]|nr:oxidoreductase [Nitratidesulfovibrio oxamicus]